MKILTYRMSSKRIARLKELCGRILPELTVVPVDEKAENTPLGLLSGDASPLEVAKGSADLLASRSLPEIDEEMLVFAGLPDRDLDLLLKEMRASGLAVELKAVETETNCLWSGKMLEHALRKERESFRNRQASKNG